MSKRKQTRAIQKVIYKLCRQLSKLVQAASLALTKWLTRTLLIVSGKQRRNARAKAGFVLPTVTLLLLVVSLVIGAILFRTGSRTNQVIGAREEQVIYNAATPAIERAKAKLEYLFLKDKRFPSGPPSDEMLLSMITNSPDRYGGLTYNLPQNPYKFDDETQINLLGDGNPDPAWSFQIDVDGDGVKETVVYSINLKGRQGTNDITTQSYTVDKRAKDQVVRNGPLTTTNVSNPVCRAIASGGNTPAVGGPIRAVNENDWTQVGTAKLRKTFQVDAIVLSRQNGVNRTVATLEFQQDRQLDRGNKWGAWFRYDLEIFPGQPFNWNGAMYTAGNMIVGDPNFRAFLISARNSCFYSRDASEIKVNRDIQTPATPQNPSFQGQFVSGKMGNNGTAGGSLFQVMQDDDSPDTTDNNIRFNEGTDSVSNGTPSQIALDPVLVFTQDISQSREAPQDNIARTDPGFYTDNAGAGSIGYFNAKKRLMSSSETAPFIDDTYRADDRYGPKPYYDRKGNEIRLDNGSKRNGLNITDPEERKRLTNTTLDPLDTEFRNVGLDGYWERRAHVSGLRVIVGERLELGNPFGWVNSSLNDDNGDGVINNSDDRNDLGETEPLYPANQANLPNADRQRRTLRDNLAAVQGTVVYQATPGTPPTAPTRPIACIATTAHPGTRQTISNSKNFQTAGQTYGLDSNKLPSDFFTGLGTNGWEYSPPPAAANLRSGDWGNALRNLANFAGEYQNANDSGAFPPTQGTGNRVYPHPYLTMWGNFSNLSRAMYDTNNSIADNSYLESAACTLGMLAYNVNGFEQANPDFSSLSDKLSGLFTTGTPANGIVITPNATLASRTARVFKNNVLVKTDVPVEQLTPDDYLDLLPSANQPLARLLAMKLQIARDRQLGFIDSTPSGTARSTIDPRSNSTPSSDDDIPVTTTCSGIAGALQLLCPEKPKFPALYYVFPQDDHARTGIAPAPLASGSNAEPYLVPPSPLPALPAPRDPFRTVNLDTLVNDVKPLDIGVWPLPRTGGVPDTDPLADFNITLPGGGNQRVSLIDNALYNGRELMTVRTLDIDLDLLRTNNNSATGDTWLPGSGVVYAFREDAVREDAVSRPSGGGACNNYTAIRSDACLIRADINSPRDPSVANNGISPKSVDFFPDPDRRPHGFRLRNGRRIDRDSSKRGLTFISDNPVYIQGDFNFHSRDGNSNNLEEFNQQLNDNWGNFYDRQDLNPDFSRPATDTWRPAEILADGITILSDNFQEGSIDRGIIDDNDGGRTGAPDGRYSFRAMNGPSNPGGVARWVQENGTVIDAGTVSRFPIKISRNGSPIVCSNSSLAVGSLCPANEQQEIPSASFRQPGVPSYVNSINQASATRVNASLISGIVPSRINQSYGGFHNFPRFIERWGPGTPLRISGSFLQLNFSSYATAPFELNQWEPNTSDSPTVSGLTPIQYYLAPDRLWGYDIGLQYAPAGPAAQRFLQPPAQRSEFYRELPANDPYICQLRRAGGVDPNAQTECPQ
ncbi:hormogonium polysaccharide biosynthesis protein HpsA [Microseira sp. BLCC-F43]|uniref:hormogonium polysaccharide biosynthesis protein HpsA n=1 Tax=Microseira sp. BLCC-F43 TaxID=3153602 RepID=UPI0035B6E3E1